MRTPVPFYIVTAQPVHETDPGTVTEGHYVFSDGIVTLTSATGVPLSGGWNYELEEGETAQGVAQKALRQWLAAQPRRRHRGPINYPPIAIV
jgi:hypothetical protein